MDFLNKLDRKIGKYAVRDLTLWIVGLYFIGYLLRKNLGLMSYLTLDVNAILHGQIWRLVTWIMVTPFNQSGFLMTIIAIYFFYLPIGRSLERVWGTFLYNVFILGGIILMIITAFFVYFVTGGVFHVGSMTIQIPSQIYSVYYISLSVFLAYAMTFPNEYVLIWFIIPLKMKWMALVYFVIMSFDLIDYLREGLWFIIIPVAVSLVNFVIFYYLTRNKNNGDYFRARYRSSSSNNKINFTKMKSKSNTSQEVSKHKCAICGRTELTNPELEFRFCSKCNGNYEYCSDHLNNHEHIK